MREIKFRGLRLDGKGWIYGHLFMTQYSKIAHTGLKPCIQVIDDGFYKCSHEIIPSTVGQFTGLKDRNGKEIYEGDAVSIREFKVKRQSLDHYYKTVKSHIIYSGHGFWVNDESFGYEGEGLWDWDKIKVIGNIHENPELLK